MVRNRREEARWVSRRRGQVKFQVDRLLRLSGTVMTDKCGTITVTVIAEKDQRTGQTLEVWG